MKKFLRFVSLLCLQWGISHAQIVPFQPLNFNDLSAFQPQAGNWRVVGQVAVDPHIPVSQMAQAPVPAAPTAKKGKKGAAVVPPAPRKPVTFTEGTGILLNINQGDQQSNLLTAWEHGDIEIQLEVMLPKGSNSGIYLQNRYEIQLLDSWGKPNVTFGDMGGIYRGWGQGDQLDYMGKSPRVNAAKAPGLWQTLAIGFRAPRFDAAGNKTENARFVYVDLNGTRIHENVEVPTPTRGGEEAEAAKGPIQLQGDHGPVAFRNFCYRLLEEKPIALTDIRYQFFDGFYESMEGFAGKTPTATGNMAKLTALMDGSPDQFGAIYKGNLEVSEPGRYALRLHSGWGRATLAIDGQPMHNGVVEGAFDFTVTLPAGKTPFELVYHKETNWLPTSLGIFNIGSFPVALHGTGSFISGNGSTPPIFVDVAHKPKLLRAFLDFAGNSSQRLTHTLAVGHPGQVHYIYDLATANPVCLWRGEFLDATPMWFDRGDGSYRPRGAVQYTFTGTVMAIVPNGQPFANTFQQPKSKGYKVPEATGMPVFLHELNGAQVEDQLQPGTTSFWFTRKVSVRDLPEGQVFLLKVATGQQIEAMPDGSFAIDHQYYIRPVEGQNFQVTQIGQQAALVASTAGDPIQYDLVW
jgi:hypothetical protein